MSKFNKGLKRFQNKELANVTNSPLIGIPPSYGTKTHILNSQDALLIEKGGTGIRALDVYFDLASDPHAFACIDKLVQEIISRDFIIKPATETKQDLLIADWVQNMLEHLGENADDENATVQCANTHAGGFDALTKSLALSILTGIQPAEILWALDEQNLPYPLAVKPKDARLFIFEADSKGKIYPKLLVNENSYNGRFLPNRKFIFHTYWAIASDDAYGLGLGRQLYYPIVWKREAFTYWLAILDKFTDPLAIGKAPDYATDAQIDEFKTFLSGIARETSAVLPEGWDLDIKTVSLTGAIDVLEKLIANCDRHISLAILGEATTGEQNTGSYKDSISNNIRIMKAKAISDGICNTLNNTLIKWAVKYRFGENAKIPKLSRIFEEPADLTAILQHFQLLKNIGFPISFAQIEELTGYKMDTNKAIQLEQSEKAKSVDEILAELNN